MPAILVYATAADLRLVLAHLNADEEIAFLVSAGSDRWQAVEQVPDVKPGRTLLWHRPGGPLPLLQPDGTETVISDPFAGWTERVSSNVGRVPFFGSIPVIVTLDVPPLATAEEERVPMSAFGWIRDLGVAVQREGMPRGRGSTVFALPESQRLLAAGFPGELNPPAA